MAASAATLLVIAGLFQLADGVQVVAAGALRGLRDTRVPMLFAAVGYWAIGLPVGLLLGFPLGLGVSGIWIGLARGLAAVAALMLPRWRRLAAAAPDCFRDAPAHRRPSRSRPCGAAKSSAGPTGTMPVGFMPRWLS